MSRVQIVAAICCTGQKIVTTFCPVQIIAVTFCTVLSYNNPKSLSTCPKIFRTLMPVTHFLFKLKARLEEIRVSYSSGPCCDRTFKFSLIFFILKIIVHYRQSKQFIGTSTHDGRIYTRSISTHLKRANNTHRKLDSVSFR